MTKEKRENIRASAWLNLFVGLYNMYLYSQGDWWFNFIIGSLCIGAWVFFKKIQKKKIKLDIYIEKGVY